MHATGAKASGEVPTHHPCRRPRRALHELRLLRCVKLKDAHLGLLAPLAPVLRVLSLAVCTGLTAGGAPYLASLTGLESLDLTG